jgi:hypothetical protein
MAPNSSTPKVIPNIRSDNTRENSALFNPNVCVAYNGKITTIPDNAILVANAAATTRIKR